MIGDAAQQEQSQSETTVGASAVAAQPAASAPAPEASTASDGQHAVSPLARRIAAENNVDLAQVKGNSPHGRVTREDVINYIGQASTAAPDTVTPVNQANNIAPAAPAQPAPAPAPVATPTPAPALKPQAQAEARGREERVRLSR